MLIAHLLFGETRRHEGYPELAKYLCKLDFMMADLMNAKLVRTKTLAEGGDFRYSLKE